MYLCMMLSGRRPLLLLLSPFLRIAHAAQPSAPAPIEAPLRELPWGQLNFLHTTDVHGWFGGHLQEASFAADWGDYISFAKHLSDRTDADGSDLLIIDTGDRVEGNGLYDASEPKGQYVFDIMKEQKLDLLCSGNHELYKDNSSMGEFNHTVPNFRDNYLASNLDILNPETGKFEPLARRYKTFTTKNQGIRILAFGFMFDFKGNSNNTIVHTVADTIKQEWFKKAVSESDVDLIVVTGHVPVRSEEYTAIFKAIRSEKWDTPIQFFGGHTHIRDYVIYDSSSTALESGRYMETLGFLSISGLNSNQKRAIAGSDNVRMAKSPKFSRLYIDNNLFSLHAHSGTNASTFSTPTGAKVSQMITTARTALKLDETYGCAPQDYWLNRAPYPSNSSILTLLENDIIPSQFGKASRAKEGHPALVLSNSGAIRFDIFKGPFTRDTTYLVSPFTSGWSFLRDVPYGKAKQILTLLNNEGPIQFDSKALAGLRHRKLAPAMQGDGIVDENIVEEEKEEHLDRWRHDSSVQMPLGKGKDEPALIPGYTTHDDAGTDGDDTIHSKIQFYSVPNVIQAAIGFDSSMENGKEKEPEVVDVVYNDFIQGYVLLALEYLGEKYGLEDVGLYINGTQTDVIREWVIEEWADKC